MKNNEEHNSKSQKVNTYQWSQDQITKVWYRLGRLLHELKQYHDDPLTIIKAIIANFHCLNKEQARTKLERQRKRDQKEF